MLLYLRWQSDIPELPGWPHGGPDLTAADCERSQVEFVDDGAFVCHYFYLLQPTALNVGRDLFKSGPQAAGPITFCRLQTYNTDKRLNAFYKVISTNTDGNVEFVSTMEGSRTPVATEREREWSELL